MKKLFYVLLCALVASCAAFSACKGGETAESFKVTFVQENGERIVKNIVDGQISVPSVNAKRGYSGEWSVKDFSNVNKHTVVYAVYTANTYEVSFDLNGGLLSGSDTLLTVTFDSDYELPEPQKEGYDFVAWQYNGGTLASSGKWNIDLNVTLVAEYREKTVCEIRFVQDGLDDIVKTVYAGSELTDVPVPQGKSGYDVKWDVTDFSDIKTHLTVKAVYTAKTYSVKLDPDGGVFDNGALQAVIVSLKYGDPYELPSVNKEGFEFVSWRLDNESSVSVKGDKWNIVGDVTLKAYFKETHVRVILFIQEGCPDVKREVGDGEVLTDIPMPQPKVGYEVEWYVTDFEKFTGTTVKAVYTPKKYSVTLDPNGGEFSDGSTENKVVEVTFDAEYELPSAAKYGYDFIAWKNGDASMLDGKWAIDFSVTLKAYYKEKVKYDVKFVQDGFPDKIVKLYDGESLKAEDIPTPEAVKGHDVAWDKADLVGFVVNEHLDVKAVATPKTYTVTFMAKGTKYTTKTVKYGEKLELPYVTENGFKGWRIDGVTSNFSDSIEKYEFDRDVTFIAVFEEDKNKVCNVTVEIPEGKELPTISKNGLSFTLNVGEKFNSKLEYPKDAYTRYIILYYYYKDSDGNEVKITDDTVCITEGDLTVYIKTKMQWTENY